MRQNLMQLQGLVRSLSIIWDNSRLITVSTILQNMASRADKIIEEEEFAPYLDWLRDNAQYAPNCHVSQWAYSEADMIVQGYYRSQEEIDSSFILQEDEDAFYNSISEQPA